MAASTLLQTIERNDLTGAVMVMLLRWRGGNRGRSSIFYAQCRDAKLSGAQSARQALRARFSNRQVACVVATVYHAFGRRKALSINDNCLHADAKLFAAGGLALEFSAT
jgi:hypothetical protein